MPVRTPSADACVGRWLPAAETWLDAAGRPSALAFSALRMVPMEVMCALAESMLALTVPVAAYKALRLPAVKPTMVCAMVS